MAKMLVSPKIADAIADAVAFRVTKVGSHYEVWMVQRESGIVIAPLSGEFSNHADADQAALACASISGVLKYATR